MVVSISDKVACTHLVVPYNITTIERQDDGMVGWKDDSGRMIRVEGWQDYGVVGLFNGRLIGW